MSCSYSAVFVLTALVACSGTSTSPSVTGIWGGEHIALTISDTGSHAEMDCAHGDFAGTVTGNSFDVIGTFVREHGGPFLLGEVPDSHPASYVGSVSGETMTLTIRLTDSNEVVGVFTLTRGSTGLVFKCL